MTHETSQSYTAVIRDHFWHDMLVIGSFLVLIFGGLFVGDTLELVQSPAETRHNFTELASSRAGQQTTSQVGTLVADLFYELGWSGDGVLLADVWMQFVGMPTEKIFDTSGQTQSIADAAIFGQTGAVLGATTETNTTVRNQEISPFLKDTSAFALKERPIINQRQRVGFFGLPTKAQQGQTYEINYSVDPADVSKVEFYVDSSLVTTDTVAPYFLGSDTDGVANGYSFEQPGQYYVNVKVYYASGPTNYLEDGVVVVVE